MGNLKLLDVLIGLVLMMSVTSLAASTMVEAISAGLRKRAKNLEKALDRILWTAQDTAEELAGRVQAAVQAREAATRAQAEAEAATGAAKIKQAKQDAADTEAAALAAEAAAAEATKRRTTSVADTDVIKSLKTTPAIRFPGRNMDKGNFPSYIAASSFVDAVAEIVASPDLPHPTRLEQRIAPAAKRLGGDAAAVRAAVAKHFDEAMERTAGIYKRWTTFWLFLVGFAIAVIGNVSVFHAAQSLWVDGPAREAVVAAATQVSADHTAGGDQVGVDASELESIDATVSQLQDAGLPVGWTDEAKADWGAQFTLARVGIVVGWFVTAMLVTLGAPFWFDLLSRLIALRSSAKGKDDTPKDVEAQAPPTRPAGPGGGTLPSSGSILTDALT